MKLIINDIIFEIDYEIKPTANLIIKSISTDGDIRSLLRDDVKNAIDALLPELIYDRLMEGLQKGSQSSGCFIGQAAARTIEDNINHVFKGESLISEEVTAEDALTAIIKLASIGAAKFSSNFDKELLDWAINAFTSEGDTARLWALAMVGSSSKEEMDLVTSVLTAFDAKS